MEISWLHATQIIKWPLAKGAGQLRRTVGELTALNEKPMTLGVAFALGTLMSLNPLPVVDMVLALALLKLVPRLPRAPYLAAMAMWNSLVMAPVYAAMPRVGRLVVGSAPVATNHDSFIVHTAAGAAILSTLLVMLSFLTATTLIHITRQARPLRDDNRTPAEGWMIESELDKRHGCHILNVK